MYSEQHLYNVPYQILYVYTINLGSEQIQTVKIIVRKTKLHDNYIL